MPTTEQVRALAESGLSEKIISLRLGCSVSTVRRLLRPPAPDAGTARIGRPPVAIAPASLVERVAATAMNMSPNATDHVRTRGAWDIVSTPAFLTGRETAEELAVIAQVRDYLSQGKDLPQYLVRQVRTRITEGALKTMRGGKRAKLDGFSVHRKLTITDEFGKEIPLRAMWVLTGDDMTLNYPFWYECADTSDKCAGAYGKRVSRAQLLMLSDVATGFIVGFLIVAKRSDGYSQRDVMALLQRTMIAHGVPREGTQFERGVWKANRIQNAIRFAGMTPHTAFLARSKAQERVFGVFQERMPGIICQLGLGWEKFNLGRYQDDYRDNQQLWVKLRNGKEDPEKLGIPHISEMERVCALVCDQLNGRRVQGRLVDGIPQVLWETQLAEDGAPRQLTEAERWAFARNESETKIVKGNLQCETVEFGKTWYYFGADWFSALGENYECTVRFDPADPTTAAVFNRATGARAKVRAYLQDNFPATFADRWAPGQRDAGLADGEFVGLASLLPDSPYFARFKTREMELLGKLAQEHAKFARIQCSILGPRGARLSHYEEAHDGKGNSRRLETGQQKQARADAIIAAAERVVPVEVAPVPVRESPFPSTRTPSATPAPIPRIPRELPATPPPLTARERVRQLLAAED